MTKIEELEFLLAFARALVAELQYDLLARKNVSDSRLDKLKEELKRALGICKELDNSNQKE